MTGRAGRPGFDASGTAVIMTSKEDKEYFSTLELDVVESYLPSILPEIICAEISQRVIQAVEECVTWLKNTYFFLRVKLNPAWYGFSAQLPPAKLEKLLVDMCTDTLEGLTKANIVEFSSQKVEDGGNVWGNLVTVLANPAAHIMTKHMVKCKTMSALMEIPSSANMYDIITVVSQAEEVAKPVLRSEKKILNDLMRLTRFPLKLKVQEPFHKAYVLLLSAVYKNRYDSFNVTVEQSSSNSVLSDFSLRVQQSEVVEQSLRLLSSLLDYCIESSKGELLLACLRVTRALKIQMWEHDYHVFDQCNGLTFTMNARLRRENLHDINDVLSIPSKDLQKSLRCSRDVIQTIYSFSKREKCSNLVASFQPFHDDKNGTMVSFKVSVMSQIANTPNLEKYQTFFEGNRLYHLVVFDKETSELLCYRRFFSKIERVEFHARLQSPRCTQNETATCNFSINLFCDRVVGQDFCVPFPPETPLPMKSDERDDPSITLNSRGSRKKGRKVSQSLLSFPTSSLKRKNMFDDEDSDHTSASGHKRGAYGSMSSLSRENFSAAASHGERKFKRIEGGMLRKPIAFYIVFVKKFADMFGRKQEEF